MGKVIKVIDLLNMIAKGEKLPLKIKFIGEEYQLTNPLHDYISIKSKYLTEEIHNYAFWYNTEVEILDEEDEIDIQSIEEIEPIGYSTRDDKRDAILNDLVIAVKQLDNKLNKLESNT